MLILVDGRMSKVKIFVEGLSLYVDRVGEQKMALSGDYHVK